VYIRLSGVNGKLSLEICPALGIWTLVWEEVDLKAPTILGSFTLTIAPGYAVTLIAAVRKLF
jgi:hypothetical protein